MHNDRYSRQRRFAPIGTAGQERLESASVLIVGTGALGASLAQHMVRSGVGHVRIVDRDFVEPSNLQRQVLFDEEDARLALPKAVAAANRLRTINSMVKIEPLVMEVNGDTVQPLLQGIDLVLDGTDNVVSRHVLNQACFRSGIPFLYGGVAGSGGMSALFRPGSTCCLACVIGDEAHRAGELPETANCETLGVISPAVEFTASLQAVEALKFLVGDLGSLRPTWIEFNLWPFRQRELSLPAGRASCSLCGSQPQRMESSRVPQVQHVEESPNRTAVLCGRDSVQVTIGQPLELAYWSSALARLGCTMTSNPYLVRAELPEGGRLVLFPDGRVLVQGTSDPAEAMRKCSLYLGLKDELQSAR